MDDKQIEQIIEKAEEIDQSKNENADFSSDDEKESLISLWKEMIYDVYAYRELLIEMFKRDLRVKYKQALIGYIWTIFMPAMVVFSGFIIKFVMAKMAGQAFQMESFAVMSVKAVAWSFFLGSVTAASNSLVGNIGLITKIYFPREVFPMSCFVSNTFDFSIGAGSLFVVLLFLGKIQWTLNLLWLPVLFILLVTLGLAISMFFACEMVFYRDFRYLLGLLTSFGIFFTTIFFEPDMLGPTLGPIMMLNPVSPILEAIRLTVINGHNLFVPLYNDGGFVATGSNVVVWQPWYLAYAAAFSFISLFFSWMHFHKSEFLYAEYI